MIDIKSWVDKFLGELGTTFAERVWFVGLQGSYGRGEATEKSDIDLVVILDELRVGDMKAYNEMLDSLPNRELICGFLSGKPELFAWDPSDLFQLYHDTTPILGSLDELEALINIDAIRRAVKLGACNIYHGCVHNMLYEKSEEIIRGLYKSASFVLQAIAFLETGKYFRRQADLIIVLSPKDKAIAETCMALKNGIDVNFCKMSDTLFLWARELISDRYEA